MTLTSPGAALSVKPSGTFSLRTWSSATGVAIHESFVVIVVVSVPGAIESLKTAIDF